VEDIETEVEAWSWPKKKPAAVRLSRSDATSSGRRCPPASLARRLVWAAFSHTRDSWQPRAKA
jgi:hypothetical protein